jgi:IMP cyclohydrolase
VTDPDLLGGGNEKLLIYRCLRPFPGGLAVSNGAQTDLIWKTARYLAAGHGTSPGGKNRPGDPQAETTRVVAGETAVEVLRQAFQRPHLISGVDVTAYEPDPPAFTPRISGLLAGDAALAIVRRLPDGVPERRYFAVPLVPGQGRLLATYAGQNRDPLPSFEGDPREVGIAGRTPQAVAEAVFETLGPKCGSHRATDPNGGDPDLRVGAAALFRDLDTGRLEAAIINRTEDGS